MRTPAKNKVSKLRNLFEKPVGDKYKSGMVKGGKGSKKGGAGSSCLVGGPAGPTTTSQPVNSLEEEVHSGSEASRHPGQKGHGGLVGGHGGHGGGQGGQKTSGFFQSRKGHQGIFIKDIKRILDEGVAGAG